MTAERPVVSPSVNPWLIALTVTLATFMELLDTSIANVSLPYIGGGLGRSYDEVTWILTTYLVANAVVLPMSAWLSRVFGRKNYYLACVALFTLTSLFCGLAPTLGIHALEPRAAGHRRWRTGAGRAGRSWSIHSPRRNGHRHSRCTPSSSLPRRRSARCWAAGSRTTTVGAGSSSSIFRLALLALFLSSRLVHDPPAFDAERARP